MVDNTIALQVRPFQMPDIGQIYGNIQNLQMNRMRMAEAQETAQERNALRGLLSSGVDPYSPEGLSQVRRVAPMLAAPFEQAAGQRAAQQAQVRRYNTQADADRFKLYRGQLGGVNSQDAWTNWRNSVVQEFPQFAASIPERFSPQTRLEVAGGADLLIQRATAEAAAARSRAPVSVAPGSSLVDPQTGRVVFTAPARPQDQAPISVAPGNSVIDRAGNVLFTAPARPQDQAPISVAPGNSVIDRAGNVLFTAPERAPSPVSVAPGGTLVNPRTGEPVFTAPERAPSPVSVAPGGTLVNPRTGEPVFTAPERPETPQVIAGPDGRPITVMPRSNTFTFAQETAAGAPVDLRRPQTAAPPANMMRLNTAVPPANMMLPNAAAATLAAGPGAIPSASGAPAMFAEAQERAQQRQLAQRRGELAVAREEQPARVEEAGQTAEAQARGRVTVEQEEETRKRRRGQESIESVLNDMVASYTRLNELGGIPSEQRSGLANVPAYLAGTTPGQEVGKALGTQSQTQRNQIQASVRQLLTAIKNATGMSAQEMNSNVELQQLLAAVSSPTQSIESVRGILASISRQYGLGQLNFPEPPAPAAAPSREQTPGPRRGAASPAAPAAGARPTLEQFLGAARRANPNVPEQALIDYYNRTYGGR